MAKPRILIVDDEQSLRSALSRWFTMSGFEVDVAVDGAEAVQKCAEEGFDVVTMDIDMPHLNGWEAIREIRVSKPDLPIVVLTGFGTDEGSEEEKSVSVLTKPMRMHDLEVQVRKAMAQSSSS